MGSFITRDFAAAYGDELNGIILYGSGGTWPGGEEAEKAIQKICDEGGAKRSDPEVAGQLMGWMFARCSEGVKLGNEWICSDPYVQKDHAADPFDAFSKPTTNQAMLYFIQMLLDITGPAWAVSTTSQATRTLWASTEGASMRSRTGSSTPDTRSQRSDTAATAMRSTTIRTSRARLQTG